MKTVESLASKKQLYLLVSQFNVSKLMNPVQPLLALSPFSTL